VPTALPRDPFGGALPTREVAIVGTGGIAAIHARDLSTLADRARIAAAVDVDATRLAEFCDQWDVPARYATLDDLLADRKPDLVHLCTPPFLHIAQATTCLAAGVPVLCEKPPALSLAELDSQAHFDTPFATVSQHRFGSGAVNLRGLVRTGQLGRPMTAVCHTLWYRPDEYFAVPWRARWDTEGGGPTMGHGIHQIDLVLSILGEWTEVVAVAARQARPTITEDLSAAIVRFANGAVATIVNSLLSVRQTSYLRFDFEQATVELEHLYGYSDTQWTVTGLSTDSEALWAAGLTGRPSGHAAQFEAVFDAMDRGEPLPVTLDSARSTLELIAAIYASSFTGARIARGDITPGTPFYPSMEGTGAPWS